MGSPTKGPWKALRAAAKRLLKKKHQSSTLKLVNEIESLLATVEQDPAAASVPPDTLSRLEKALVSADLLTNPDSDVRVSVVSCLTKFMRISKVRMKDILEVIIEAIDELAADVSSRKAEVVLETVSKLKLSSAMLDLECVALFLQMLQRFLEIIRPNHSQLLLLSMQKIMITVINESEQVVPREFLDILLTTVKKKSQGVSPAAFKLVEEVLSSCTSKLQPCIMKALNSSRTRLDMYSPVVSSICQSEFPTTQAHNDVKPNENEADEKNSEVASMDTRIPRSTNPKKRKKRQRTAGEEVESNTNELGEELVGKKKRRMCSRNSEIFSKEENKMGSPTKGPWKALRAAAKRLLKQKHQSSTLKLVNEIESLLATVEQDPAAASVPPDTLSRLEKALVSADLLTNPDSDVRVSVVSCLTKFMRISKVRMKDILEVIIEAIDALAADVSSRKAEVVLETVSKLKLSSAMLDLECVALFLQMLQRFLEIIRPNHSQLLLLSMQKIMITVINESEQVVPREFLDILLTTVKKESQGVSPAAFKLVEEVLSSCTSKLQPCIMKALNSSRTRLDMYSPVVSSICQSEFPTTQAHNDVKPKENEEKFLESCQSAEAKKKNSEGASMDTPIPRSPKGKKKDSRATKNSEQTPNSHPKRKRTAGEEVESNTNELGEELVGKTVDVCSPLNESIQSQKAKKRKIGSKNEQPNSSPEVRSSVADSIKQAKRTKGALKAVSNEPESTAGKVVPIESFKERLYRMGLKIIQMGGDGNCLFRALSHQLNGHPNSHADIRRRIVEYMRGNREQLIHLISPEHYSGYEAYCDRMSKDGEWGEAAQLQAAANIFGTSITVHVDRLPSPMEFMPAGPGDNRRSLKLSFENMNHYNSLVEKEMPTIVWWDYENLQISAGMNHGLAFERIVNHLKAKGFGGPVKFVVVVGYLDSPMPKLEMMKNTENIELIITNNFSRPRTAKKNQAADLKIKQLIPEWIQSHPRTHNILFLSDDSGYGKTIDSLKKAGHEVIVVSKTGYTDYCVPIQWSWCDVLGLPVRVFNNATDGEKAIAKKRAKRTEFRKANRKKTTAAREIAITKAEDENVQIPKCISLLDCGSVQIVIQLLPHVRTPAITDIDDECVSVEAQVDVPGEISHEVRSELASRLGKSLKKMTFRRGSGNRWEIVVEKKPEETCRDVYLALVKAMKY